MKVFWNDIFCLNFVHFATVQAVVLIFNNSAFGNVFVP